MWLCEWVKNGGRVGGWVGGAHLPTLQRGASATQRSSTHLHHRALDLFDCLFTLLDNVTKVCQSRWPWERTYVSRGRCGVETGLAAGASGGAQVIDAWYGWSHGLKASWQRKQVANTVHVWPRAAKERFANHKLWPQHTGKGCLPQGWTGGWSSWRG